jgi:hypothetical protein
MAEYIPKGNNTSQNCGTRAASREKQMQKNIDDQKPLLI